MLPTQSVRARIPAIRRAATARGGGASVLASILVLSAAASFAGCASTRAAPMKDATNAYNAAEYGRALGLARTAASGSQGLALDQARYLEGLSLLKLGRFDEAVAPLAEASDAANRTLAADARISLGTALVRSGDLAGAADAYRRAAAILEGDERTRALAIEADCRARVAENKAPVAAAAPAVAAAPPAAEPIPSSPTARVINGVEIEPVRFAIQAGAFKDKSTAVELARKLGPQVSLARLAPPRVFDKRRDDGSTVHVVQFGSFPNRAVAGQALRAFPRTAFTVERWAE